jgi:hypothetical protein
VVEDDSGVDSVFRAIEENAGKGGKERPAVQYNMGLAYRETGLLREAVDPFKKVVLTGEKLLDALHHARHDLQEMDGYRESLDALDTKMPLARRDHARPT